MAALTIVTASRYSRMSGARPLPRIGFGTLSVRALEGGERNEQVGRVRRRGGAGGYLGHERERALGADDELGEVVAGGGFHDLPAVRMTLAVREHHSRPRTW